MSMNYDPEMIPYTVQAGDTLWDLANEYDVEIEDIMEANPGIDPDNLFIGQTLAIPDFSVETQQRRPEERRPEERRPGRRPSEFRRPPFRRFPYRRFPYRPPVGVCPAGTRPYYVQPGDNLYNIASRFGISVDVIIAFNPFINFGGPLFIGQLICLPF